MKKNKKRKENLPRHFPATKYTICSTGHIKIAVSATTAILTPLCTGLHNSELRKLRLSDITSDGAIVSQLEVRAEITPNHKPRTIPFPMNSASNSNLRALIKRLGMEPPK